MVKIVENMCKTMRESLGKICGEKSGKNICSQNLVEKMSYSQSFSAYFHDVLNKLFFPVKCGVFHVFHIAYYYNY